MWTWLVWTLEIQRWVQFNLTRAEVAWVGSSGEGKADAWKWAVGWAAAWA